LAGMTHLRSLNLYRTQVTNAGVAKLVGLKDLVSVDLRYTRATGSGVDTLRTALPHCAVAFIGGSGERAAGSKPAAKPAGKDEKSLADWVTSMGGTAKFVSGHVRQISLAGTTVSDAQLVYLRAAVELEKLNLETTETGDMGAQSLAALANLRELNLSQTTVTDAGLKPLAALKKLRKLSLNHTLVRGPGLAELTALEELQLAGTA